MARHVKLMETIDGVDTVEYPQTDFDSVVRLKSDGTTETLTDVIDNLPSGGGSGGSVTVDAALSDTSENPVQNKAIYAELKEVRADISTKADADSVYTKTEASELLSGKQDAETGKGLSANDFTDDYKGHVDDLWSDYQTALTLIGGDS